MILERSAEGLPKLWVVRQALRARCQRRDAFGREGHYVSLLASGAKAAMLSSRSRAATLPSQLLPVGL